MKTVEELLNDKVFTEKLKAAKSLEEIADLFKEQGVDVTAEEIKAAAKEKAGEELDEQDLENVAGGVKARTVLKIAYWVVRTVRWLI